METGNQPPGQPSPIRWRQADGQPVSCLEKIKVLNENLEEIRQLCQEAFEDGLLMGCDEQQLRQVLADVVGDLVNPFRGAEDGGEGGGEGTRPPGGGPTHEGQQR